MSMFLATVTGLDECRRQFQTVLASNELWKERFFLEYFKNVTITWGHDLSTVPSGSIRRKLSLTRDCWITMQSSPFWMTPNHSIATVRELLLYTSNNTIQGIIVDSWKWMWNFKVKILKPPVECSLRNAQHTMYEPRPFVESHYPQDRLTVL